MKIFICDYLNYRENELESLVIEAESVEEAESIAIDELKALHIPKRYLIKLEEVL